MTAAGPDQCRQMRPTLETHLDFLFGDILGGGHVDEVAEDDPGLYIGVAARPAGEQLLTPQSCIDEARKVAIGPIAKGKGASADRRGARGMSRRRPYWWNGVMNHG